MVHVEQTCNAHGTHVIVRVSAVIRTLEDKVRRTKTRKLLCCTSVIIEPRLHVIGQCCDSGLAVDWQWSGSGVAALRSRSTRDQHVVSSAIDAMKPRLA